MKHSAILAQLRPPTPDLDPEWSAQTLTAITGWCAARPTQLELDQMQSPASARRPRRARRAAVLLAAAASVAVAIPVLDSDDAVAADLRDLSQAAVTYDSPALGRTRGFGRRARCRWSIPAKGAVRSGGSGRPSLSTFRAGCRGPLHRSRWHRCAAATQNVRATRCSDQEPGCRR